MSLAQADRIAGGDKRDGTGAQAQAGACAEADRSAKENGCREASAQALERVRAVIADIKGLDALPAPQAKLQADLGLSSFDMMVVCVRLEADLGISLEIGELEYVETIADLAHACAGASPSTAV